MNQTILLVVRSVLGLFFGFLLTRIFRPDASLFFVLGLSIFLVVLSYLSTYFRRSRK